MDERTLEAKARIGELCARLTREVLQAESLEAWPDGPISESMLRDLHSLKGLCMALAAAEEGTMVHGLESLLERTIEAKAFDAPSSERFLAELDKIARFSDESKSNSTASTSLAALPPSAMSTASGGSAAARGNVGGAPTEQGSPGATASSAKPREAENFLRVQVSLLDHLMGLVSELVLIRNQLHQFTSNSEDREFQSVSQRLDVVTGGLQAEIMRMRMQPVSTVTLRFQRIVRDVSKELGKLVEMHLEGNETEIDKTIVEAIRDPLTHIVRNSLDHGIETPEERAQAGKSQRGRLVIRTFQEGGQVIVEIQDDGRGIDPAKVGRRAVEKGLLTQERLARLTRKEVMSLIFTPGFSTAEKITEISGRGIGMDVVRTNIEQIGGVVDFASTQGKGTIITLRIPLTLAIVPALIVRSGTLNCAIPQVKIVELVRLSSDDASQKLVPEMLEGGPVLRLRGRLLPLLSLSAILAGERGAQVDLAESTQIVIVKSDGHDFALAVEDVSDSIDIVVKPFVGFLKSLRIFSGATVLGDGTLALILDIAGLRERCVVDAPRSETATGANDGTGDPSHAQRVARGLAPEFLLCGIGEKEVVAIPLPQVFRLEEFHPGDVEIASNTPVARYRGGLLPLILLSTALGVSSEYQELESIEALLKADRLDVVVIQRNGRHFGLVVSRIEDIIRASGQINDLIKPSAGALGTILEGEDVYTVVNVTGIVDVWLRDVMGETPKDDPAERTDAAARILFVEDSPFFRKYTASVLQSARYDVRAAAGGREALDALSAAARGAFDVVLTDIDMPGMTGLELAREIRSSDGWYKEIPIVALTSLITPRDQAAARAAGIDEHLEKVQLDQIPALLAHVLGRVWKSPQEEGAA